MLNRRRRSGSRGGAWSRWGAIQWPGQDVFGSPPGIEAVANGVPAFRQPRRRTQRTHRTELMLGAMLIGLSMLIAASGY
jgi:hypothetical protein